MPRVTSEETKNLHNSLEKNILSTYKDGSKFSAFDITVNEVMAQMSDNNSDYSRREFNRIRAHVGRVIDRMLYSGKITFVGEEQGKAPVKKKMYQVKSK